MERDYLTKPSAYDIILEVNPMEIKRTLHYFEFRVDAVRDGDTDIQHYTEQLYARSERGARSRIISSYADHHYKVIRIDKTFESIRKTAVDINRYIELVNEQEREHHGNHQEHAES